MTFTLKVVRLIGQFDPLICFPVIQAILKMIHGK